MKRREFWLVEVAVGMGPLVLGTAFAPLIEALREYRINVDGLTPDHLGKVVLPELGIELIFAQESPRTLVRIDVSDDRIRFGSLPVIGKRAHEIVGLFKAPRKETLWSNNATEGETSSIVATGNSNEQSRELLAKGTIWLTGFGLGFTLRDGLVATVHLCDPTHSPRSGCGHWTKEQQRLSEVRELPAVSLASKERNRVLSLTVLIHLALVASLGILVWQAIQLQQRWNSAIEVSALVVALDPPPPNPLPNEITVSFSDANGIERRHTLGHMQFLATPKMGEEVNVRFLPESPDKVLGPVAFRDAGFETAVPYGVGIIAIYSFLYLAILGRSPFWRRNVV